MTPPTALPNRTILSILIDEGILSPENAATLPPAADNAAAEELLVSRNLVSQDDILLAYAKLYQIPFVRLKTMKIPQHVLLVIPEILARRYDIVAYDRDKDVVHVALASPGRLKAGQKEGLLHRLQSELHLKIAPSFAPLSDIRAVHNQYASTPPAAANPTDLQKDAHAPKSESKVKDVKKITVNPVPGGTPGAPSSEQVNLLDVVIPSTVLRKFPKEIATKYQAVPFAQTASNNLSVAVLRPEDPQIKELLRFIQDRNGISVNVYQTDLSSFQHALLQYEQKPVTADQIKQVDRPATGEDLLTLDRFVPAPSQPPKEAAPIKTSSGGVPEIMPDEIATVTEELTPLQEELYKKRGLSSEAAEKEASERQQIAENTLDTFLGREINSARDLVQVIRTGNIPKAVAAIVALAAGMRASDIHIEAAKEKIRLRYRVDGELADVLLLPSTILAPLVSRIKILSQLKIDENRIPQDGRFNVRYRGREIDLRVSTLPTVFGEKVVMRILDKTTGIMTLEDMGMDGTNLTRIVESSAKPYGIILSTGPTGSGKSTTLYAILQRISTPEVNVITLEDPVEYEIHGINQTQIKPKIGFTFAEGLRSILRQDPNIIMVGEVRDKETAEMATHAALTGHLVLSTLHTNNAAGALPRLINMGIEPFLLTSSVNAIIGQRLVRKVCDTCKVEDKLPEAVIEEIKKELANAPIDEKLKLSENWKFYKGSGCQECSHGYKGRTGIFEVLVMSDKLEALAVGKEPSSAIEEQAISEGMITMKQDGLVKAIRGLTTVEEVMKATTE